MNGAIGAAAAVSRLARTTAETADAMRHRLIRFLCDEALARSERTAIADVELYAWMEENGWTRGTGQNDIRRLVRDGRLVRFERSGVRHHRDPTRLAYGFYVGHDEQMIHDCEVNDG